MAKADEANTTQGYDQVLVKTIQRHLKRPGRRRPKMRWIRTGTWSWSGGSSAMGHLSSGRRGNLDAAEAQLLNLAPARYILDQMPCLVRHVQCHLPSPDLPGRSSSGLPEGLASMIRIAHCCKNCDDEDLKDKQNTVEAERGKIVTTVRAASSAALRERALLAELSQRRGRDDRAHNAAGDWSGGSRASSVRP